MNPKGTRDILITFVLAAVLVSGCAGPAGTPVSTPGPATSAPTPAGTPPVTETRDPSEPVSSEDTPDAGGPRSPLDPIPREEEMTRGEVFIDSSDILILESFPYQVRLQLEGSLPTPCHQLRAEVSEPDEQNRIEVEVYSLVDPEQVCVQVLEAFETSIPLGSFTEGTFTVWVNGEQVGEFTL